MFVYSIVQFVPSAGLDERVNIGYFVGNNELGFRATWRPERAELFGLDIKEHLSKWLSSLSPMSIEKLIDLSQIPRTYYHVTTPRVMVLDDLEQAQSMLQKLFLITNEEYQRQWQTSNTN